MDPIKVKGVADGPTPSNLRQVRAFLGFGNFYRCFIRNFGSIARPLTELTKKDVSWNWGQRQQQAFQQLKQSFILMPVLIQPDPLRPFILETDASAIAVGAVSYQKDKKGILHPVAYFSKTLDAAEHNYPIYDRELLAIIKALEHWRVYLLDAPHKIQILTNHSSLQHFKDPKKISHRMARWVELLSDYNFEIRYIMGSSNARADALSRRPDYGDGSEDNDNVVVLGGG